MRFYSSTLDLPVEIDNAGALCSVLGVLCGVACKLLVCAISSTRINGEGTFDGVGIGEAAGLDVKDSGGDGGSLSSSDEE